VNNNNENAILALRLIYDLSIEERGLSSADHDERQAIFRIIHVISGFVGMSGGSWETAGVTYKNMCDEDFRDLKIHDELSKLAKHFDT